MVADSLQDGRFRYKFSRQDSSRFCRTKQSMYISCSIFYTEIHDIDVKVF